MNIETLVEKYVKVRDRVAELDEQHKLKLAPFKEVMDRIEQTLLAHFNETGQEAARTASGTAYRQKATSVTLGNRPAFLKFIQENDRWDLADLRAGKKSIEEYVDEHQDLPPGVKMSSHFKVNVRRT